MPLPRNRAGRQRPYGVKNERDRQGKPCAKTVRGISAGLHHLSTSACSAMDGKDVIRETSLRGAACRSIILSARDQEAESGRLSKRAPTITRTKPFGTQELMARIIVALRHANRREQLGRK